MVLINGVLGKNQANSERRNVMSMNSIILVICAYVVTLIIAFIELVILNIEDLRRKEESFKDATIRYFMDVADYDIDGEMWGLMFIPFIPFLYFTMLFVAFLLVKTFQYIFRFVLDRIKSNILKNDHKS